MPPPLTPNTYRTEIRFTQDNQQIENVLHWWDPTLNPDRLTVAQLLSEEVLDQVTGLWMPRMSTNVTLREVYTTYLGNAVPVTATATPPSTVTGAKTSPALPNNVTIAISYRTALGGRSNRGRSYLIGLCEGDVSVNAVSPGELTAWADAIFDMVAAVEAALDLLLVVLSLISSGVYRATGQVTPVTDFTFVNSVVDSQRRRLPGRGL